MLSSSHRGGSTFEGLADIREFWEDTWAPFEDGKNEIEESLDLGSGVSLIVGDTNALHECFVMDASVSVKTAETAEMDDKQASERIITNATNGQATSGTPH
jgi:hypothetical protein